MSEKTFRPSLTDGSRPAGSKISAEELYSQEMDQLTMPASLRSATLNSGAAGISGRKRWLRPAAGCAAAAVVACGAWGIGQWMQGRSVPIDPLSGGSGSSLSQGVGESTSYSAGPANILSFPLVEIAEEDANKRYVPGFFTEAPDSEALSAFLGGLPEAFPDWQFQALVGYSGEGKAVEMSAEMTSPSHPDMILRVESGTFRCYPLPEEGASESQMGTVRVVSGRYALGEEGATSYYATISSLSDTGLSITIEGSSSGEDVVVLLDQMIQQMTASIDEKNRIGDLSLFSPSQIPQWRDELLTLQQAREDSEFGSHIPSTLPAGFQYEGEQPARRVLGQNQNALSLLAYRTAGGNYSEISIRYSYDINGRKLVKEDETELYDLAPYPIPWADTMPEQLRDTLEDPLFSAQALTLEMVQRRCYSLDDQGDTDGIRCCFSVQFVDGVVVRIQTKGLAAEEIFQLVQQMGR